MPESKRVPYYSHVADAIIEKITAGQFLPSARIPSIRELSQTFNVAKSTVERALYRLVDKGILRAEQGRGIFVASNLPKRSDGQTRVVGFLAPMHSQTYVGRGFYPDVLSGIQESLSQSDRSLLVINERGLGRADPSVNLHEELVDAYIVIGPVGNKFIHLVRKVGRPLVFVDHDASGLGHDSVIADNVKGGVMMTKHLLDLGHKDIAFLGGLLKAEIDPNDKHYIDTAARERFSGFRIAMETAGIQVDEERNLFRVEDRVSEYAYTSLEEAWNKGLHPTGLVCFGTESADAIIRFAAKKGLKVPGDLSIVGFGAGTKLDGHVLSGADFDARQMGVGAGKLVNQRVERGYDAFRLEMIPVTYVEGTTTASPPSKR
jgi:DNA-binding LacI/PurR family transcriptional regulator